MAKKTQVKTFESSLEILEDIVGELESGNVPLEESLKKFEEGVKIYKDCFKQLEKAEKKITELTNSLEELSLDED